MNFNNSVLYKIDKKIVLWKRTGDETVVLRIPCSYYFLNDSASLIWRLILQRNTPQQITNAVAAKYRITRVTAEEGIGQLIKQLVRSGLLKIDYDSDRLSLKKGDVISGLQEATGNGPYNKPSATRVPLYKIGRTHFTAIDSVWNFLKRIEYKLLRGI